MPSSSISNLFPYLYLGVSLYQSGIFLYDGFGLSPYCDTYSSNGKNTSFLSFLKIALPPKELYL
jgi:hypothetical protein